MKTLIIFYLCLATNPLWAMCSVALTELSLDSTVKNGETVEFLKASGPGRLDNYLTMNLPYEPIQKLFKQIEVSEKTVLKSRGEAHITVLTPLEYWDTLKSFVAMDEINQIAEDMKIQSSQFEVLCLGKAQAVLNDKQQQTYFVVVRSNDLLKIRHKIQKLFVAKGGKEKDFDPNHFYPHITVAFSERDLHEADGVIKDSNHCAYSIRLNP